MKVCIPCAAGVIDHARRLARIAHQLLERKRGDDKTNDRQWGEELALGLFYAAVKKSFKEIAKELVWLVGLELNVFKHLDDGEKDCEVLAKESRVMDVNEREVVVGVKLKFTEIFKNRILGGVWIAFETAKSFLDLRLVNVSDSLAEEVLHANHVEILEAVLKRKSIVVCYTLPIELKIGWILLFIHNLRETD